MSIPDVISAAESPDPTATRPTPAPPRVRTPHRVSGPRHWWDWVLAADPGLDHLQAGWRSLVSMTVGLAVGYATAHALDIPAMLGLMVGGMMGMMSAFVIAENTVAKLARACLWMPIPFSAALTFSAWLSTDRVLHLCLLVVALAVAFSLLRFGLLGLLGGMMVFIAFMVGLIVAVPLEDCGRMSVIAMASAAAVLVARLVFCHPMPREELLRTQRAFVVEARRVVNAAATVLDPDADRTAAIRRVRRALRRLNVTTLTIDARLAQPEVAADPDAAELLHRYLFDAEVALQGIGQAAQDLAGRHIPSTLREAMVVGLTVARDTHLGQTDALRGAAELIRRRTADAPRGSDEAEARAVARRLADQLDALADSLANWLDLGWRTPATRAKAPFRPSVVLEQGRPAEAGPVARRLAAAPDARGWRRAIPYLRPPLQAGTAAAITLPLVDAINGQRFYWGLIGVMITLLGTHTTHERLRKLGHRVVGTVIGAVIGVALLHLVGPGHIRWTLLVIVAGTAIGSWGLRRRYAYWVICLVAALVQMYGLTTPYDAMDRLLAQRLLDNALGIVIAILCAALLFPVSTRKVAREAERGYLSALEQLIAQVAERWKNPEAPVRLRGAARGVDAALHQLRGVVRPLLRMPFGTRGRGGDNLLALLGTATAHARTLAVTADVDLDLAPWARDRIERITEAFTGSLHALDRRIATGEPGGTWVRVSPVIRELGSVLRASAEPWAGRVGVALGEWAALEEVLAGVADNRGLTIATLASDPVTAGPAAPVRGAIRTGTPGPPPARRTRAVDGERPARAGVPAAVDPPARRVAGTMAAAGDTDGTVTVRGTVRCTEHEECEAWVTMLTDGGRHRERMKAADGGYAITGLTPGGYTLVVSTPAHPPRAEFLLVGRSGRDLRHDIVLDPVC